MQKVSRLVGIVAFGLALGRIVFLRESSWSDAFLQGGETRSTVSDAAQPRQDGRVSDTPFRDFLGTFSWNESEPWSPDTWQIYLAGLLEFQYQEPLVPINEACTPPLLPNEEEIDCSKHPSASFESKPRFTPAKVGHAILLGFDIDSLEIHLNEVYDVVDKFFIIEWTESHNPQYFSNKQLTWERVKKQPRFRKFEDKVVHFILDGSDSAEVASGGSEMWSREYYQSKKRWERIVQWNNNTNFFGPNDIIGLGDADEVPARHNVHLVKHCQMKEPRLDIGIWFPYGHIDYAFRTYVPLPGKPFTLGDPTFWKFEAAFDKTLYLRHKFIGGKQKDFPDRMWGTSGPFLLGGMHMTHYGYLPFLLTKEATMTEGEQGKMEKQRKLLGRAFQDNKLREFEAQMSRPHAAAGNKVRPRAKIDPQQLEGVVHFPWFYDCNRARYPRWEWKPDTRLGNLDLNESLSLNYM